MATVNISEDDFGDLAQAAVMAHRLGDAELSLALDKIARKMNAALSSQKYAKLGWAIGGKRQPITWKDVPSVVETFTKGRTAS